MYYVRKWRGFWRGGDNIISQRRAIWTITGARCSVAGRRRRAPATTMSVCRGRFRRCVTPHTGARPWRNCVGFGVYAPPTRVGVNKTTLYPSATCPPACWRRLWRKRTLYIIIAYTAVLTHFRVSDGKMRKPAEKIRQKKITRSHRGPPRVHPLRRCTYYYTIYYGDWSEFVRRATRAPATRFFFS